MCRRNSRAGSATRNPFLAGIRQILGGRKRDRRDAGSRNRTASRLSGSGKRTSVKTSSGKRISCSHSRRGNAGRGFVQRAFRRVRPQSGVNELEVLHGSLCCLLTHRPCPPFAEMGACVPSVCSACVLCVIRSSSHAEALEKPIVGILVKTTLKIDLSDDQAVALKATSSEHRLSPEEWIRRLAVRDNRTRTPFQAPGFKSGGSTNSAILASLPQSPSRET